MNRREKALNLLIEKFFEEKKDLINQFYLFERVFKTFKCETIKDDDREVYLLDFLTIEQKIKFRDFYNYAFYMGGNYHSKLFCNDSIYRASYRFSNKLVLINHLK